MSNDQEPIILVVLDRLFWLMIKGFVLYAIIHVAFCDGTSHAGFGISPG